MEHMKHYKQAIPLVYDRGDSLITAKSAGAKILVHDTTKQM